MIELQIGHPLEILEILLVRAGISPLHVVKPEAVQPRSQQQLVVKGETDPLGLGSVAEGRIVNLKATHGFPFRTGGILAAETICIINSGGWKPPPRVNKKTLRPVRASGLSWISSGPVEAPTPLR